MPAVRRQWVARWGLPAAIRVDNGAPWGGWSDVPPALAVWRLGLGMAILWNRPRHYAVVERGHGVRPRWVDVSTGHSAAAVPARRDAFVVLRRERSPACDGQSRMAASPGLAHRGRPYDPAHEARQWEARPVWAWLAARVFPPPGGPGRTPLVGGPGAGRGPGVGPAGGHRPPGGVSRPTPVGDSRRRRFPAAPPPHPRTRLRPHPRAECGAPPGPPPTGHTSPPPGGQTRRAMTQAVSLPRPAHPGPPAP